MDSILEKIYKSSLKLLEPLNPEETYQVIVKEAIKLVGADYASLLFPGKNGFEVAYSTLPIDLKRRKKGNTYKAFKENKAYVLQKNAFSKTHPGLTRLGLISNVYIPISYRNKSIGVLIVNSKKERYFTEKELNILQLFGSMASLGIRKTQLYDQTQKALELREQFIPLAAHELRTPLTSINGYIQLLYTKLSKSKDIEGRWISELNFESKRMTRLVAELVEINRINSNQLNLLFRECLISKLIENAISSFEQIYPDRKIKIKSELSDKQIIIGDQERLTMVISHLLDNAAKFSPSDTQIDLNLKQKPKEILISIQDYGDGISKQDLAPIFEGFYKGQFLHKTGLGLGLFLTKAIIEAHKGEIKLKSKLKKGTKVTLTLPKARL